MQDIISKKSIGERLKSLRSAKGLSQIEISEALGLSRSHYSQVELGKQFPTYAVLFRIAEFYDKSYEWILHGSSVENVSLDAIDNNAFVEESKLGTDIAYIACEEHLMYTVHRADELYINQLPTISLPTLKQESSIVRAFQNEGDNIGVQLNDQDIVISEYVVDRLRIVVSRIYVFVLSAKILIRRIEGYDIKRNAFECYSDFVIGDRESICLDEIEELWEVKGKISFKVTYLGNTAMELFKDFQHSFNDIKHEFLKLKQKA